MIYVCTQFLEVGNDWMTDELDVPWSSARYSLYHSVTDSDVPAGDFIGIKSGLSAFCTIQLC